MSDDSSNATKPVVPAVSIPGVVITEPTTDFPVAKEKLLEEGLVGESLYDPSEQHRLMGADIIVDEGPAVPDDEGIVDNKATVLQELFNAGQKSPESVKEILEPTLSLATPPQQKLAMLFFVQGGAGDVICATPMIRYWRHKYPDDLLVVLSTYPQLWEGNPNVDKVHPSADPEDIFNMYKGRMRFFKKHFVYDHILDGPGLGSTCLPEFICRVYDAEYDGRQLDYFLQEKEIKFAKFFMTQFQKPVVLLHLVGSIPSEGGRLQKVHGHKDINVEDLKPVIEKYKTQFDLVQIGLKGEPICPGAIDKTGMPMREAIALIPLCKTFIFIESLFAHAAAALCKTGVVVFNNTNPAFFGHPTNVNLAHSGGCVEWPCNRPMGALVDIQAGYYDPMTRARPLWTCPNQLCSRTPPAAIESALLEALKRNEQPVVQKPALTLAEARGR